MPRIPCRFLSLILGAIPIAACSEHAAPSIAPTRPERIWVVAGQLGQLGQLGMVGKVPRTTTLELESLGAPSQIQLVQTRYANDSDAIAAMLEDAELFLIAGPLPVALSANARSAICRYVQTGGGLLVTEDADGPDDWPWYARLRNHALVDGAHYDGGRVGTISIGAAGDAAGAPDERTQRAIEHALAGPRMKRRFLPSDDYFEVDVLADDLRDPIEIGVAGNGDVFLIEREGAVRRYDAARGRLDTLLQLDVARKGLAGEGVAQECGGLGLALDPGFDQNGLLYLYYSAAEESVQRLTRWRFDGETLLDEVILLTVPTDRENTTCHEGGSLAFGPGGLLFLSTGDNTNPFESDGFAPIDERPDRKWWDAQRSAGNSNDLRGSVLRIRPLEEGGYEIPEGNLWPPGTAQTRPEIYAKGVRNPYRISVDPKTATLYWGDVGPDAAEDGDGNPMGYDEVNQAKVAGYFGWPYYRGGRPYRDRDFAALDPPPADLADLAADLDAEDDLEADLEADPRDVPETSADPAGEAETPPAGRPGFGPSFADVLQNDSPNNTGRTDLPSAVAPLFAYPYDPSEVLPELMDGGRNAMAGPVCYPTTDALPPYFDHVLLYYDWMRGFLFCVVLDDQERFVTMHRFLGSRSFSHPIDLERAADGSLYLLEYGSNWWDNPDGRLTRIRFGGFDRRPVAIAEASVESGAAPLTVALSSRASYDPEARDDDPEHPARGLRYSWDFGDGTRSSDPNPRKRYLYPRVYEVTLTVTDAGGRTDTTGFPIVVGNTAPVLSLEVDDAQPFAWDAPLPFALSIIDAEDGVGRPPRVDIAEAGDRVEIIAEYFKDGRPEGAREEDPQLPGMNPLWPGTRALRASGCTACHHPTSSSVGPSFARIALSAAEGEGLPELRARLASKIRSGGSGVWGTENMPGHDHLGADVIEDMAIAITSFATAESSRIDGVIAGIDGTFAIPPRPAELKDAHGVYAIWAKYTDQGAKDLPCLTKQTLLRYVEAPPVVWEVSGDRVRVPANAARIEGKSGARGDDTIGWIDDPNAALCWSLQFGEPGEWSLSVEQASISKEAGSGYRIVAGDTSFVGAVCATGGWDTFVEAELGTLSIDAEGIREVRLQGDSIARKYLGTFRELILRRVAP